MSDGSACMIRDTSPATVDDEITSTTAAVDDVERLRRVTGLPFSTARMHDGVIEDPQLAELCATLPRRLLDQLESSPIAVTADEDGGLRFYAVKMRGAGSDTIAAGFLPINPHETPKAVLSAGREAGWSVKDLNRWSKRQEAVSTGTLIHLLKLAIKQVELDEPETGADSELDELAGQLDAAYEELSLLHEIARHLRVSLDRHEFARLCLNRLHQVIDSQGSAVILRKPNGQLQTSSAGDFPHDPERVMELLQELTDAEWNRPLVRNNLMSTPFAGHLPGTRNLAAATILDGRDPVGWIVTINAERRREFGTIEASLLHSVAVILSTHLRNVRLFLEQEELLVSFVRSLVSTLDAKDSYTRGHSERVALVARRLADELGLSAADQELIHLSALLHDIGKIGVQDAILLKPGKLTAAEERKLRLHPVIGDDILSGLKNMRSIVPGVRNHHENYDGTGYPDRLEGEDIPLMARILSVADAYDAMGSHRPYRGGMPLSQVEAILTRGSGVQWDPQVVRAYFAARDDIRRIWESADETAPDET